MSYSEASEDYKFTHNEKHTPHSERMRNMTPHIDSSVIVLKNDPNDSKYANLDFGPLRKSFVESVLLIVSKL